MSAGARAKLGMLGMPFAWLGLSVAASLVAACSSSERGPDFPTSSSFPEAPRRGPSFAAEPSAVAEASSPPRAAAASAPDLRDAVVPLDSDAARELVSRFFTAVLLESSAELFPLFAQQAWVVSEGSRQPAQALWRARLAQLDYTSLSGRIVGAPQSLRTYTFQSASRAKQDGVPVPAAPGEVVIVATPVASWTGFSATR